jgi:hypothetical protein
MTVGATGPGKSENRAVPFFTGNRAATAFVLFVWSTMLIVAFASIVKYGRNIPLAEDWTLVAPLTGNEHDFSGWLWAQNNEHRIPLPKLILLGLLKMTNGDFRAGMFFNAIALGVLSILMMLAARNFRGRTTFADAFFPIALLHIGNWENIVWGWQLSFVLPTFLVCAVFLVLLSDPVISAPFSAIASGVFLMLLPLCGANGLLFVPLFSIWLCYCGVLNRKKSGPRWITLFLTGSSAVALSLMLVYFIGYVRPAWNPPNPGYMATLKTSAKFLALGLGPAAAGSWRLSAPATAFFLFSGAVIVFMSLFRIKGGERFRALGIFLFFGNMAVFALAMGWGRAGHVPEMGLPIRYVLLSVPALCTAFFIWELYGPVKLRNFVQTALLFLVIILLPFNMIHGLKWGGWYRSGMEKVKRDILAGAPYTTVAESHRKFLIHWWDKDQLANGMQMLQKAGIGIFAEMHDGPITRAPVDHPDKTEPWR